MYFSSVSFGDSRFGGLLEPVRGRSPSALQKWWGEHLLTVVLSPVFRAPFLKEIPFTPVGRPHPDPSPKPSPCEFSLLYKKMSSSEVPERRGFGEEACLGSGGVDREKEGRKDSHKRWVPELRLFFAPTSWSHGKVQFCLQITQD